ncbi:AI-2E family transporter [Inquilinus limosus]|uniref:Membrane protein n=1 Tax=Inquilinus limosus MP06 TaxID=1398085 RepID=A0A0A0D033_9PROT|nr:AI-2E family transporter [Inquilinus limosus]KGM30447.1 membrane protein [Inquilinus limosus MP06]
MNGSVQIRFWLIGFVVFCLLVWLLSGVLAPFVTGMIIAYLLDPVARRLQAIGMARWLATTVLLLLFVLAAVLVTLIVLPILLNQVTGLLSAVPDYVARAAARLQPLIAELRHRVSAANFNEIQKAVSQYAGSAVSWIGTVIGSLWQGGMALIDLLSLVFITPVVAFYMLRDWDHMIGVIDHNLPVAQRETIRGLGREVNHTLSRFIRGQLIVCLLLGLFYAIALTIVGLNFGLLVGLMTGLLSIIPYVGSLVGLVSSVGIALVQYDDWTMWALVLGIFLLGQFLEGNFVTPKLVGESVGLHPVWVIFALLAAGSLFGFTGVMLAVPMAAVIGVLTRFALHRYRQSALYRQPPADPPDMDLPTVS